MAVFRSLALIAFLLAMPAIVSESRVARKDLGIDLGGVGLGVGAGVGLGLGGSGSGSGAGAGSGSGPVLGHILPLHPIQTQVQGQMKALKQAHMRDLMQGLELGQGQVVTKGHGGGSGHGEGYGQGSGREVVQAVVKVMARDMAMERVMAAVDW